jgi:hypothetical protein
MIRTVGKIAYWVVAIALAAAILVSLEYTSSQALLIALVFCPCSLALEFFMPKARKVIDKVYLSLSVLVSLILLILICHHFLWAMIVPEISYTNMNLVPPMLINPVFLGLILTALAFGDYFWSKWLNRRFRQADRTITFHSDRKSVTLRIADIAYIESNDTEVKIETTKGEIFRNKTRISQWENLLGDDFLRIHRSYLVNADLAELVSPDVVSVHGTRLPVSRKYKEVTGIVLTKTEIPFPR